jgi:ribosomal protein S18 acetylase RimI-like enzyme
VAPGARLARRPVLTASSATLARERADEARLPDIARFIDANYPALLSFRHDRSAGELARDFVGNDDRPPGIGPEQARSWLLHADPDRGIAGLLQLYEGHPTPASWYVGLLVLDGGLRSQGWGARIVRELLDEAGGRGLADLRVAIDPLNVGALRFWHGLGFARIGKIVARDPGYTLLELVNDLDRGSGG